MPSNGVHSISASCANASSTNDGLQALNSELRMPQRSLFESTSPELGGGKRSDETQMAKRKFQIDQVIINFPYEEPSTYWSYDR